MSKEQEQVNPHHHDMSIDLSGEGAHTQSLEPEQTTKTASQEIEVARRVIAKSVSKNVPGCVNSPESLLMYATILEKIS